MNAISAITWTGDLLFDLYTGSFNAELFCSFLVRLDAFAGRPASVTTESATGLGGRLDAGGQEQREEGHDQDPARSRLSQQPTRALQPPCPALPAP